MSSPYIEFAEAEIGVFWDIVDCPIPKDLCPKSIFLKIKSALENIGYVGKLSISAYSDMDQNPQGFESTGITLLPTGNKRARLNGMSDDFIFFAVVRKRIRFNLLIISEDITDNWFYARFLLFCRDRTGNILLSQPEKLRSYRLAEDPLSFELVREAVTAVWLWKYLSYGGKHIFNRGSSPTFHANKFKCLSLIKEKSKVQRELKVNTTNSESLSYGLKPINRRSSKSKVQGESSIVKVNTTNSKTENYPKKIKVVSEMEDYTNNIKLSESSSAHRRLALTEQPVPMLNKFDVLASLPY